MSIAPVKPTVVLTVDDHPLIRSALREALRVMARRVELLEASNPEEGLALLGQRPDTALIFLDLNFQDHDGLAFIERFREAAPAVPLIVYTMHEDPSTLKQALARGAAGVIPKTHSRKLLQGAVQVVIEGGIYLPPHLARQLAVPQASPAGALKPDVTQGATRDPKRTAVTPQQRRILELLAQGLPNKEIARKLGIAANTVKNQLTMVFDTLRVSNRTQAAIAARALVSRAKKAVRDDRGTQSDPEQD